MSKNIKNTIIYIVLAIALGALIGAIESAFGWGLTLVTELRDKNIYIFLPLLALGGLVIVFFFKNYGGKVNKGMGLLFGVWEGTEDKIPLKTIPLMIGSTWLSHLFGGSVGREGVAVQIGAATAHRASRFLHDKDISRVLMVAGMAAGFGGFFRAPLTATIFALEVLSIGEIQYKALLPSAIAAYTSNFVAGQLGIEREEYLLFVDINITVPVLFKIIMLGAICGLVGAAFAWLLKNSHDFFEKTIKNPYIRIVVVGIVVSGIMLLTGGRYSGSGSNIIEECFVENNVLWQDWILKLVLTAVTLAAGFKGGEVAPMFCIGTALGFCIGKLFGLPPTLCAALGYSAVFGSGTGTVIAPILMGGEIFGWEFTPLFVSVCIASRLLNQWITIYPAQKFAYKNR